jgi:hypothetical protein
MTVAEVAPHLPAISELRDLSRALAMLDAILSPEWEFRYYSFDSDWSREDGVEMASMRNGEGDDYSIVFSAPGAYVRGFTHESPMSPYGDERMAAWPGVLDEVPGAFCRWVEEPTFSDVDGVPVVTACLWRLHEDGQNGSGEAGNGRARGCGRDVSGRNGSGRDVSGSGGWRHGTIDFPEGHADPDGSTALFGLLVDRTPEAYRRFAEDYYEVPVDLEAVRHVYNLRPLTKEVVGSLNPEITIADLAKDIAEIGSSLG